MNALTTTQQQRHPIIGKSDDLELMTRLAGGDMMAMSDLYDRYAASVNGLALRITGHAGDAAEVVQEVFLQVWRQAGSYEARRGSVVGWLYMIARTRALDLVRARARRPLLELEPASDDSRPNEPVDPVETPECQVLTGETVDVVRAALAQLSAPERLALELSYFEDLSHSEIAERTGLPLGTVKTHIARAIRKLRLAVDALQGQEASER